MGGAVVKLKQQYAEAKADASNVVAKNTRGFCQGVTKASESLAHDVSHGARRVSATIQEGQQDVAATMGAQGRSLFRAGRMLEHALKNLYLSRDEGEQVRKALDEKLATVRAKKRSPTPPPASLGYFEGIEQRPLETVTKRWYDWDSKQWKEQPLTIRLKEAPFAQGNMRLAFAMWELPPTQGGSGGGGGPKRMVAKSLKASLFGGQLPTAGTVVKPQCHTVAAGGSSSSSSTAVSTSEVVPAVAGTVTSSVAVPSQVREIIEDDARMQATCQAIATAFNAAKPPKTVSFVEAYIILRPSCGTDAAGPMLSVEPFLEGEYVKHNNNYGFIDKDKRNTPQAFSHFSNEFTKGKMLVIDIQGVGDVYTDPQIHTADGTGFGKGNLGPVGIRKFYDTHWCNPVCVHLGLPFHVPTSFALFRHSGPHNAKGTHVAGQQQHQPQQQSSATVVANATVAAADLERGAKAFRVQDFLTDLKPVAGSAKDQDLALLGITAAQFDNAAALFRDCDGNGDGILTRAEAVVAVCKLDELQQSTANSSRAALPARWLEDLMARLNEHVTATGQLAFVDFLCIWTGNA